MLTREQINFFSVFGYIILKNPFSSVEVDRIRAAFDEVMENHKCVNSPCEENSFSEDLRHSVLGFVESHPDLVNLFGDDRIYETLSQLLDPGFIWVASDGNLYPGDTPWHSDKRTSPGYKQIKVSMYLDPVTAGSGCLRVIPGSHEQPYNDILRHNILSGEGESLYDKPLESFGVLGQKIPCAMLESQPGDVVFFRQEIFHASFGGGGGRRMFAMGIFDRPMTEELINSVTSLYRHHRNQADEPTIAAFFNSDVPRIRDMQIGLREMGIQ